MKKIFFILFLLFLSKEVSAWGAKGHKAIAEIAFDRLTPKAAKAISALLNKPHFIDAANYMDEILSDTTHPNYQAMAPWHFINVQPDSLSYNDFSKQITQDSIQNVYKTIVRAVDSLKANPSNIFWLKCLIHMMGDMHQPLHVGRTKDLGGNLIHVQWEDRISYFSYKSNLHSVWDDGVINFSLEEPDNIAALLATYPEIYLDPNNIMAWCYESYTKRIAVYNSARLIPPLPPKPTGPTETNKKQKLNRSKTETLESTLAPIGTRVPLERRTFTYMYYYKDVIYKQLMLAGRRLALLLNDIYDK